MSGAAYNGIDLVGILTELFEKEFFKRDDIKSVYGSSAGAIVLAIWMLGIEKEILFDFIIRKPWNKIYAFKAEMFLELFNSKGMLDEKLIHEIMEPLLKSRGLISADRLVVTSIGLTNGDKKSMIWEFFYLGDYLVAHQNFTVQSKVPGVEYLFEFRKIVLGDPLFTRCIHQKCNLRFTDEIEDILEVKIDGPSRIFNGDKIFRIVFGTYVILHLK